MLKSPLHPTAHLLKIVLEHIVECYKTVDIVALPTFSKFEGYTHLRLAKVASEKVRKFSGRL